MKTTKTAIEMLAKHHSEFISAAKSIAGNNFDVANYAEDYVQEAYIKLMRYDDLYDKVINGDKASKGYMFFTLRSIIINDLKRVKKCRYNHVGDQYDMDYVYELEDKPRDKSIVGMEELEDKMYDELESKVEWFDFLLFKKYITTKKSFRILSEESGIGIQTIYLSIKKSKLIIAEALHEDYVNYKKENNER